MEMETMYITNLSKVKTIKEANSSKFEEAVSNLINKGYKLETASCNSSYWKAIMILKRKE